ncbi:MAG: MobC family plasmid mobilization relaxosome protein [Actinomycetota bacterium]|nr:MobC family plasmid mobilization relaxosome protein [Actinomycetota bacterium]
MRFPIPRGTLGVVALGGARATTTADPPPGGVGVMEEEGVAGMGERDGVFRRRRTDGRREHRTVIKHTEEEWVRVKAMAVVANVSVPRLYERALRSGGVVAAERLACIRLEMDSSLRMIGLVGNNLNQLARVANASGEVNYPQIRASAEMVDRHMVALRGLLRQIAEAFPEDTSDEEIAAGLGAGPDEVDGGGFE